MNFESIAIILITIVFAIYFSFSVYSYFYNPHKAEGRNQISMKEKGTLFFGLGAINILFGYTGVTNKIYIPAGILFLLFGLFCFYKLKNENNT